MVEHLAALAYGSALFCLLEWRAMQAKMQYSIVSAANEQLSSCWWAGSPPPRPLLHVDQEMVDAPLPKNWTPDVVVPAWVGQIYHFERWRAPRVRGIRS